MVISSVNDTAGTADASWAGLPTTVAVGDFAIYNSTTSSWDHITGEATSGGQVDNCYCFSAFAS